MQRPSRLLRTSTFRLSVVYLGLFVLSVIAVLGYIYFNTAVLLARQTDETINAEITGLSEQYRSGGTARLVRIVAERSRASGRGIYLLTDARGRVLAGNLRRMPPASDGATWIEFDYAIDTAGGSERHAALGRLFRLAGGYRLLVGRDIGALRHFESLVQSTLIWALGLTVLLGLLGGILMSRGFLARIEDINATSRTIMGGDLSRRIPVAGTGDELDRLAGNLNNMLDEIERLMAVMRQVTDNIAHDLRTPLTRLRARIEDALRSGADRETTRAALVHGLEDADRLITTFNALLSIARIEGGSGREAMQRIDVGAAVSDAAELYEPVAEERGVTFTVDVAEGLEARAERQLIGQAAANLIDNAMKYVTSGSGSPAENKPAIRVSARRASGDVEIAVADNGPGIPEADRARVFDRFVRLEQSRTQPGSGLGLSLVAAVARLHGGSVKLYDNAPGLRAVLTLPAAG